MEPRIAIAGAAVIAAMVGGIWAGNLYMRPDDRFATCRTTQIAGGASQIGGSFDLLNAKGETVTDKDVITGPTLVYFGYTFCPDVCPMDAARNAQVVEILEEDGKMVTPVFISVDPQRDTPEIVGEFAQNFHERMIGLTGSPEQIRRASQAYKTYYKADPGEDEYYLVDHTTLSYLVTPKHGFLQFFRRDTSAEDVASQIGCFLDNQ